MSVVKSTMHHPGGGPFTEKGGRKSGRKSRKGGRK